MAQPQTAAPLPQVRNRFIWISALYGTATIALSTDITVTHPVG